VLHFHEIIKTNLDLVKSLFVVPLENVADCMKEELVDLRILGPNTCFKLIKFVILPEGV